MTPGWTLTWRDRRGMTSHVSDTWAGTGRRDQWFPWRQPRIHGPPRPIILSCRVTAAEILIGIALVVNEFILFYFIFVFLVMEPTKQPYIQFFAFLANVISTASYMDPTPCIDMPFFHLGVVTERRLKTSKSNRARTSHSGTTIKKKNNFHKMGSLTMSWCPRSWRSRIRQTRTSLAARPA